MQKATSEKQSTGLTVDKLRTFPGYEHKSDDELSTELESIIRLTEIIVSFMAANKNHFIDNQQVVYLDKQNNKAA